MNCRIFTIPRAVLLFDKYNKCRYVEISTKLLCRLYQKAILKHFVNIGQLIFCIDASYSSNNNSILNSSEHVPNTVSVEFLPFVSKNIPSISNLNEYFDNVPKDLFIEDTKQQERVFQYIEMNKLISEEKAKRKAQLLEELRMLEED